MNAATGESRWTSGATSTAGCSTPAVSDCTVYVGDEREPALHALSAGTGEDRWTVETEAPVVAGASAAGDSVVFGTTDGVVRAVDAETGGSAGDTAPARPTAGRGRTPLSL